MQTHRSFFVACLLTVSCALANAQTGHSSAELWQAIKTRPNIVVLARHTETTTGNGIAFDTSGNCATELMLTAKGRTQASFMGKQFRDHGVEFSQIVSSAMCRNRDTAMLAFGRVELDPALRESFTGGAERQQEFLSATSTWVRKYRGTKPMLILTHHPNINSLVGEQPDYGEVVVCSADDKGELDVIGTLRVYRAQDF